MTWFKEKNEIWMYNLLSRQPTNLNLEMTWRCNLNCGMCPRKSGHGQKDDLNNKDMSLDQIEYILNKILYFKSVNIIGAGEPMLHPEFYDALKLFESKRLSVKYTTNGTLLTDSNVKRLTPNVKRIAVSIDSSNPEMFYEMRGTKLNNIVDNLKTLKKQRPDVEIAIQMLVMQDTLPTAYGIVDIANKVQASVSLIHPICFTEDMLKTHIHEPKYQWIAQKHLDRLKRYAHKKDVSINMRYHQEQQHPCNSPWKHLLVAIDGTIYPCCYIYEGRGNGQTFPEWYDNHKIDVPMHQYKMGNIFTRFEEDHHSELKSYLLMEKKHNTTLSELRKKVQQDKHFWYCDICLKRWRSAC